MIRALILVLPALFAPLSLAQDFSAVLREPKAPIESAGSGGQTVAEFGEVKVKLVIDPVKHTRGFLSDTETTEQQFRLMSRYALTEAASLLFETGSGMKRTDNVVAFPGEPALQQQLEAFQRATLSVKAAEPLTVNLATEARAGTREDASALSQSSGVSAEAVLVPWKDSALRAGLARRDTSAFDGSIVMQDIATVGVEKKITWIPITLHSTAGRTWEEPTLAARSVTDRWLGAADWKPSEWSSLSAGYEFRSLDSASAFADQDVTSWFTKMQLRPLDAITLSVTPAVEKITAAAGTGLESSTERTTLSVGGQLRLADSVTAGITVKYPLIDEAATAPLRPYFSLSATASF